MHWQASCKSTFLNQNKSSPFPFFVFFCYFVGFRIFAGKLEFSTPGWLLFKKNMDEFGDPKTIIFHEFQEDPVLCGAMLMLRFFPRAMLAYEVESKVQKIGGCRD